MPSHRDTRARAPGKLMLAGEYAILHGSDAWVMAVDRYAVARDRVEGDSGFVPPEARAAWTEAVRDGLLSEFPDEGAFAVDLGAMNRDGRKLGVGSSAAGCVAALAWAVGREAPLALDPLRPRIARVARRGHRRAQNGGSGVDVIASALGGVVHVRFPDGIDRDAVARRVAWPASVKLAVLWSGTPVKTWEMISRVDALKGHDRAGFDRCVARVTEAATRFGAALESGDPADLIAAVRAHHDAMAALGERSGAPIVTESLARLAAEARPMGAAVKPSGAGGGDVSIAVAEDEDALDAVCSLAAGMGFARLTMDVDADGVVLE